MYATLPAFILGFHGCDQSLVEGVICGRTELRASKNDYDWLGHGIYFWENDPIRALEYAQLLKEKPRKPTAISEPAVLGAVIDLGHCLNLMESTALSLLRDAYETLRDTFAESGIEIPENRALSGRGADLLVRKLDCAVIQLLHAETERKFDTVRGLFFEGEDPYPNAGFKKRNHIQVCVVNPNCIKGYFLPRSPNSQYPLP